MATSQYSRAKANYDKYVAENPYANPELLAEMKRQMQWLNTYPDDGPSQQAHKILIGR